MRHALVTRFMASKTRQHTARKTKHSRKAWWSRPFGVAGLIFFATFAFLLIIVYLIWSVQRASEQQHLDEIVNAEIDAFRASLESQLNQRLALPYALKAFVLSHDEIEEDRFQEFASALEESVPGVMSLQLAPDAVVEFVSQKERNASAIGHDLRSDPQRRPAVLKSIEERAYIVAGPVDLLQGGTAIIARLPIFVEGYVSRTGFDDFWGFATILLDVPVMLERAGYSEISERVNIAIRGKDGLGLFGDIFAGNPDAFEPPYASAQIILPNGRWIIAGKIDAPPQTYNALLVYGGAVIFVLLISYWLSYVVYRQANRALRDAYRETRAANALKNRYVEGFGKRLQKPLHALTRIIDETAREMTDAKIRGKLDLIRQTANNISSATEDLVDFARLESGTSPIQLRSADITEFLHSIRDRFEARSAEKMRKLKISRDPATPAQIMLDTERLRQILTNFIDNAFRHAPSGSIYLNVAPIEHTPGEPMLRFSVRDEGPGISKQEAEQALRRFELTQNASDDQGGEHGLGLPIARQIASILSANIGIIEHANGAEFWVDIPLTEVESGTQNAGAETPKFRANALRSKRLLLVAKKTTLRDDLETGLRESGADVSIAANANEATLVLQQQLIDQILVDCWTDPETGHDIARHIRELGENSREIIITALARSNTANTRGQSIKAGMDDVVKADGNFDDIIRSILRHGKKLAG